MDGEGDPRLDPMERRHAQLAPPFAAPVQVAPAVESPPPAVARAVASLESLLPALVKKIAWSGDARRGTVRMELGAGALEGGVVLIHADHGEVSVRLRAVGADAPSGAIASIAASRPED